MGISGELQLQPLIRKMATVTDGALLATINANLAEAAIDLVKEGFEREEDPYGTPWAPLKHREGKILQDTGRLKNSFSVGQATADAFRFGTNVAYAAAHQSPRRAWMPQRRMVPDGSTLQELPEKWLAEFTDIADEIIVDFFTT